MRGLAFLFFFAWCVNAATHGVFVGYNGGYSFLGDVEAYLERQEQHLRARGASLELDVAHVGHGVNVRYVFTFFEHLGAMLDLAVEGAGISYAIADTLILRPYLESLFGLSSDERYLDGEFRISLQASSANLCIIYEFPLGNRLRLGPFIGLGLNVVTFDEHYWWPAETRMDYEGEAVLVRRNAYRIGSIDGVMAVFHLTKIFYVTAAVYYRFGVVKADEGYGATLVQPFDEIDLSGPRINLGIGARFSR